MNNFKLSEDTYIKLLEYLVAKPYAEVYQLLPLLENLEVSTIQQGTHTPDELAKELIEEVPDE